MKTKNILQDRFFILVGKTPVPKSIPDIDWLEDITHRRVRLTKVGPYTISTVFLSINHNFGDGPPLLFETMAWTQMNENGMTLDGRTFENYQRRCSTWEQAEQQHATAIEEMKMPGDEVVDIEEEQKEFSNLVESIG